MLVYYCYFIAVWTLSNRHPIITAQLHSGENEESNRKAETRHGRQHIHSTT